MNAIPLPDQYFAPAMQPLPPRESTWIGRTVQWVRAAENYSIMYKASVAALAVFASIAMLASVVGVPLFILFYKEFIRQEQRELYEVEFQKLFKQTIENGRHHFTSALRRCLQGETNISTHVREQILEMLNFPRNEGYQHTDQELLIAIAAKDPEFRTRFKILLQASDE